VERCPELGIPFGSELELLRQNTDDRIGDSAERNRLAEHRRDVRQAEHDEQRVKDVGADSNPDRDEQRTTRAEIVACLRPMLRPTLVALVLATAGTWCPGPPLAVAAAGSIVFVAASLAFGAVGSEDWALARRALRGSDVGRLD
jgi:hypothetical protein